MCAKSDQRVLGGATFKIPYLHIPESVTDSVEAKYLGLWVYRTNFFSTSSPDKCHKPLFIQKGNNLALFEKENLVFITSI